MLRLALVTVFAASAGCISALPPTARIASAQVLNETQAGARLAVTLELSNPNAVPLPLPRASYTLAVDGAGVYAFDELPARVLPPNGTQTVRLPAAVVAPRDSTAAASNPGGSRGTSGGGVRGRAYRIRGSITYEPENGVRRFLTESGVPLPAVAFTGRGVLE